MPRAQPHGQENEDQSPRGPWPTIQLLKYLFRIRGKWYHGRPVSGTPFSTVEFGRTVISLSIAH